jgi:SAM-dependent methyltransferase
MDRKEHWEKVYNEKSPLEVSWYQSEPRISLELIAKTECSKDAGIIDVGGGSSVLVSRLLEYGYQNLAVLDISSNAIAYAKNHIGAKSSDVEWFEADVTRFSPPHQFGVWHDRAVFHFLTAATDRNKYVRVLRHTLQPGGHLIIAAFALGGPQKCSGLDIVQYNSGSIAKELGDGFSLVEECHEVHITPTHQEQMYTYFRFIMD